MARPGRIARRAARWLGIGAGASAAVVGLALASAYGLAQTDGGRAWIARTLAAALSTPGETEIAIGRLEGRLPQQIRLVGLSISDRAGPWLDAERIEIDWRPWALLRGEVRITDLRAVDLAIARRPEGAGGGEPGRLPALAVAVERLSVADLRLGVPLLGEAAAFRIAGEATSTESGTLSTKMSIVRSDGGTGGAQLDAIYRPDTDTLGLDLAVNEPAGGLIARAFEVPELPALTAFLSGEGPLSDWPGELTVSLEDLLSIHTAVTLSRGRDVRFRIAGSAATARPATALPWRLVAGDTTFAASGAWGNDRVLTIDEARLDSPVMALRANGRVALARLAVEARAEVRAKEPTLIAEALPGAAADGLVLTAEAKGPLLYPAIDATLVAARLTAPDIDARGVRIHGVFAPTGALDRPGSLVATTLDGDIAELIAADLADIEPVLGRQVAWSLAGTLDPGRQVFDASRIALRAGPAEATGTGTVGLADGAVEAALHITVADLSGLSPLLDMAVQGRGAVDARIAARDFGAHLTATLTGDAQDIRLGEPVAEALVAGRATVAGELVLPPGGGLSLGKIVVETPASRVTGELALPPRYRDLTATYTLSIPDAAVLSPALGLAVAGRAEITGTADGQAKDPTLAGQLTMSASRVEGFDLGRLDARFRVADVSGAPRGRLDGTASAPVKDLQGGADFTVDQGEIRLSALSLRSQGTTATGALTIPLDGAPVSGSATVEAASLTPWLARAGLDGAGAARGTVRLFASGTRQGGDVTAMVTAPSWRPGDGTAVTAAAAEVTARSDDLIGAGAGRLTVEATDVRFAEVRLASLSFAADGTPAAANLRLAAAGDFRGPLAIQAAGRAQVSGADMTLEIASADGQAFGQTFALHAPATVTQSAAALALGPLDLSYGAARLRGQARLDRQRLTADLRLESLPVASLAPLWSGAGAKGDIAATIAIDGPRDNPVGSGRLTVTGVTVEAVSQAPPLGIDVRADWRDRRLVLSGRLTGTPERDAELTASLPLAIDAQRHILVMAPTEPVAGRVSWYGELASIWPLVPLDGHHLSGATELDLELAGSLAAPAMTGAFRLSQGTYEYLASGTVLKDLAVRVDLADRRAVLSALSASDGARGTVRATGEMALDPARRYPFAITAEAAQLVAIRRDDATATASGQAKFSGTLDRAAVSGAFETETVEVRLVDRLPADVVVLDVVESGGAALSAKAPKPSETAATGLPVDLDVAVVLPRRVFVRGRGLESEWAGNIKVSGTAAAPVIEGDLTLVRGQMTALTRTFRLKEGSVHFPGGSDVMPLLDVVAEHSAKNIVVTARVSGPAANPTLTLSSVPALPRDEIVSRVLFGKGASQLSALEAAQLASAVAELSGTGGGAGRALDFARGLLGADVLRLNTATGGAGRGPRVEAGKYVADDVYLSVKKGVADSGGSVGVEIELTPNISVESETKSTGQSDVGIKFKWDY